MVGITNKIMLAEIRRQQKLSQELVAGQTAISTGVTLNKPSDDSLAWVQVSEVGRAQAQQAAWQTNVSYGQARSGNAEANLSEIDNLLTRAQAQQAAWQTNVSYGQARSDNAEANLSEIDNLLTRAQELVTSARNGSLNATNRSAIVEEMSTIRTTINELLNQKDYQGVSVFDDEQSVLVPVSRGLNLAVVGTKQDVSTVNVDGTPMSIDDILAQGIAAVQSGDDAAMASSVSVVQTAQGHITVEQAKQGVRSDRLEVVGTRLTDVDLSLTEKRSNLESTKLEEVIANVKAGLLQLEAAQTTFARINQQTLFDLIK